MLVKDVMRTDIVTIGCEENLTEAARKMLAHAVNALIVTDGERPIGIIGLRDLFTTPISASHADRMYNRRSEQQLVEAWRDQIAYNLFNDEMLTVSEDMPLMQAIALMVNSGKHPLPVTRGGAIVGMIERADVVRALLALAESS